MLCTFFERYGYRGKKRNFLLYFYLNNLKMESKIFIKSYAEEITHTPNKGNFCEYNVNGLCLIMISQ